MDPLSLVLAGAAAGGVASKLAEKFTEYLADLIRGQDAKVQEAAAINAAAFVAELTKQIDRLAGEQMSSAALERSLGEPDVATTMRTALIGAARTSSAEKHDALARAIAERLRAAPESNEALASALAVDAIPKLSNVHLRFLGIAAVSFVVRPLPDWYFSTPPDGNVRGIRPGARYPSYSAWLKTSLEKLHLGVSLGSLQIAHLASVGCLTFERKLRRDLAKTLLPDTGIFDERSGIRFTVGADIEEFLFLDAVGKDLNGLWEFGLQHVTLTPAGTLIGTAVYESVGGDPIEVQWSRKDPPEDDVDDDVIWDGRDINERFLSALDRAIKDRAERRVRPWDQLDG